MNPNLLYNAVNKIVSQKGRIRYSRKATFVTPQGNIEALAVVEHYTTADFATGFCEETTIRVSMSVYNYRRYLYSHRDNLRCILQKLPIDPVSNQVVNQGPRSAVLYRAFLLDNEDAAITRGNPMTSGTYVDGKDDLRFFTVQLVDVVAEYASIRQGGAGYRFTKTEDILKSFILAAYQQENGPQSVKLNGLEVFPLDVGEKEKLDQVLIPHNTNLVDVPGYLQEFKGGLYNQGLGSFIVGGVWYIYPLYHTQRFKTAPKRLVVYQVPTNMIPVADRTYSYDGSTLTIVCSGAAKLQDISVSGGINGGNGVRFTRASEFLEAATVEDDNAGKINRSKTMAEFQTSERADGFSIGKFSDNAVTDNLPNEMSKLAVRGGQLMVTTWQNSDVSLIFPGMPVRVYQDIGGKISARDGTVIQTDEQAALERPGLTGKVMTSVGGLVMFLSKDEVI